MSVSTKNRPSTVVGGGGGGSGGDDEDDDGVGNVVGGQCKEMDDSEEEGDCNREIGKNKGKEVSCFRFRKVKRTFLRRKRKGVSVNSERRKELGGGGGGGCYLCLKRPLTSDSGGESQTSDPNSPNFTYDMLRVFIEKNDFYSKECNTHLDVESKSSSNQDDK